MQTYYAIIPANVRYCEELPICAKLLYWELTTLVNKDWFCGTWNKYFALLYWVSEKSVSQRLRKLSELWFIKIELSKNVDHLGRIVTHRKIFLN